MFEFSIVIPAYNESQRLPKLLASFSSQLDFFKSTEFLIVEDGSRPDQVQAVAESLRDFSQRHASFHFRHLVNSKNGGKGSALERGFLEASAPWVGFVDADGSTSVESVVKILSLAKDRPDYDALLGSRILKLGSQIQRDAVRHYIGRVFITYFFLLFKIPAYDTQCGCKFFKRAKVLPLLNQIKDRRWVWDTELVVLCWIHQFKMKEISVDWKEVGGSRVSLFFDPIRMAWALFKFRFKEIPDLMKNM
jgi:dolichyl-phosphate beta-glucosyltransferase